MLAGVLICFTVLLGTGERQTMTGTAETRGPVSLLPADVPEGGSVNANTDDPEDLTVLPGIGETIAAAWVDEYLKNGPFFYPEDLLSVRGIGAKKLMALEGLIDFSVPTE